MILLINICNEKLHELEFVKPIEDILNKNNIEFKTKHYSKIIKNDLKSDKIIICGTSLKDNDFLKNLKYFEWLRNFNKSVLGICGGSHIIGLILGNKLKKKKEIGLKEINIKKEFLEIKGKRKVYHLHNLQVLPETFNHQNFYATLFHPEVRNKKLIVNFCNL
jgi:GMP synthase (glutamine-hydrolysing)|tara:strand:- start:3216 stop:3704 length:489 start_codon:yes stop_codon:yes gene_type:complete